MFRHVATVGLVLGIGLAVAGDGHGPAHAASPAAWRAAAAPGRAPAEDPAPAPLSDVDDSGAPPRIQGLAGYGPTPRSLAVESEYDAVRVPDAPALNPRSQLTIELWVKRQRAAGCASLVSKGMGTGYWLGICDGRLRFTAGGPGAQGSLVLPEGRWVHVAATFDGTTVNLYAGGSLDRSAQIGIDTLAATAQPLVIGADAAMGAFFPGWIDHVRLWSIVRTQAEIRDNLLVGLSPRAGLVAQWPLDGNARDLAGGHDGRAGGGAFTYDGVMPRDITLPLSASTVAVDGHCDPVEYGSAERVALEGGEPVTAYVQVSTTQVYVCVLDMAKPPSANALLAVSLDRNLSRDARAAPGDYRFLARHAANPTVEEGDGAGGWKALTLPSGTWEVARTTVGERWSAEVRAARSLLEPPRGAGEPFATGLSIIYAGVRSAGDDYAWPPAATAGAPSTWSRAELAEATGFAPRYAFTGVVQRPAGDDRLEGIGGVSVNLVLAEDTRLRLADTAVTDQGGHYRLDYQGFPPDAFVVRELDPRGVVSVAANAGLGGTVAGNDLLVYTVDEDAPPADTTYVDGRFVDAPRPAPPPALRQHYLVAYAAPVAEDDLAVLVDARRAQGFRVVARSVEDLARAMPGRDTAEKIHNWLEAEWTAVEPEPVYALLVGRGDKIPFRDIGWLDNDHRDPRRGDYYPAWPTDWYYADIDSSWDADGDGYFGEFLGCAPGDTYPSAEGDEEEGDEDGRRDCPEAGSLAREGPYGALREPVDDFRAEIAVGRLPVNGPGEVRRAIEAIVAAETGGAEKRRAVVAGAFWHFEGQSWSDARQASVWGGEAEADPWIRWSWDGGKPYGYDAGEALDQEVLPRLQPAMAEVTRLYESTAPDGDARLVPTLLSPTAPLTAQSLAQSWLRGAGLVHLAGLGSPDGVFQARWTRDWDGDRQIDQPAAPGACAGQPGPGGRVGPPCLELEVGRFFDARLASGAGAAPIVVANAGATTGIAWRWDGVDAGGGVIDLRYGPSALPSALFGRGAVAGWLGSLTPIQPGALDRFQARAAEQIAGRAMRLGDAAAVAMADLARRAPYDPRSYGAVLLGDPAATYWGAPADTTGAWPQDGGDWRASGGSVYAGPVVPEHVWTARDPALGSAPAIGRHGELVVAGSGAVVRYAASGAQVNRGAMASPALASRFSPALADGRVYVAAGGTLQVFDANLGNRADVPLPSGATASGAPRIGSDGTVWVPTEAGMLRVDGAGRVVQVSIEPVRGAPAWLPTGELVWSTTDGRVQGYRVSPAGEGRLRELARRDRAELTAPAVSPVGTVFVGAADGRVYALPLEGQGWQLDAGGAVRARPAIGPDGRVYVANAGGRVSAFAAERSEVLWTSRLGTPVTAGPAVDGSQLYVVTGPSVHALDLATGKINWTVALEGATDERAGPVIGPDRALYITRADQSLVVIREAGWLAAPSDVAIETGATGATVRWRDNSADEIGFRVELCDAEDRCEGVGTTPAGATRWDVRALPWPAGTRFSARVQALARGAGGGVSSTRGSTVLAGTTRRATSPALAALAGGDTLLGPDVPQGSRVPAGPASPAADSTEDSDFAVSRLRAAPRTRPVPPFAAAVVAVGSDTLALRWRWDGGGEALLGFNVSRRVGQAWQIVAVLDGDARSYSDKDLVPATAYDYQVVAVGEGGASEAAAASGATSRRPLSAVAELRAEVSVRGVLLRWHETNLGEREVVVERLAPGTAVFEPLGRLGVNADRFMDRYLLLPGIYSYRVKSVGAEGDSPYAGLTVRNVTREAKPLYLPVVHTFRRR